MKSMACELVGRVLVLVQSDRDPDLDDWSEYIVRLGVRDYDRVLIWSDGGGPNATQRAMLNDFWKGKEIVPAAMVSISSVRRRIITALNWLGFSKLKAFEPRDVERALAYIGAPPEQWSGVRQRVFVLQERLGRERSRAAP